MNASLLPLPFSKFPPPGGFPLWIRTASDGRGAIHFGAGTKEAEANRGAQAHRYRP